jgi:hypothetical protein
MSSNPNEVDEWITRPSKHKFLLDGVENAEWEHEGYTCLNMDQICKASIDIDAIGEVGEFLSTNMEYVASEKGDVTYWLGWHEEGTEGAPSRDPALDAAMGISENSRVYFQPNFPPGFSNWKFAQQLKLKDGVASDKLVYNKFGLIIFTGANLLLRGQSVTSENLKRPGFSKDLISMWNGKKTEVFTYNLGLALIGSMMGTNFRKGAYIAENGPIFAYLLAGMYGLASIYLSSELSGLYDKLGKSKPFIERVYKAVTKEDQQPELIQRLLDSAKYDAAFTTDAQRTAAKKLRANTALLHMEPTFVAGSQYLAVFGGDISAATAFRKQLFLIAGFVTADDKEKMHRQRPKAIKQLLEVSTIQALYSKSIRLRKAGLVGTSGEGFNMG